MIKYIIKIGKDQYVKYTDTQRAFGGKTRLTDNVREAKMFTRKRDADRNAFIRENAIVKLIEV